jgi:recombination protein RecA
LDVVQKSGSWFAFGDVRLGQGKEKAVAFLAAEPALEAEVRERVLAALAGKAPARTPDPDAAATDDADAVIEA